MRWIRAGYRMVCCGVLTVMYYSVLDVGKRFARDPMGWRNRLVKGWGAMLCRVAKCKLTIHGEPPKAPFVLVCNHLSYVDIPILLAFVEAVPIAKKELRSWPILGYIFEGVDVMFVDRTRRRDVLRINEQIAEQLSDRQGLLFFPEGKISEGADVLPFKPSLLAFPASQKMPVSYATLTYRTPVGERPASEAVCWARTDEPLLGHVFRLLQIPSFEATLSFGSNAIVNEDRKELAAVLWQCVKEQFVPVDSEVSV